MGDKHGARCGTHCSGGGGGDRADEVHGAVDADVADELMSGMCCRRWRC